MPVFAPGVSQGLLQGLDASRQEEIRRQNMAMQKQQMDFQALQMETARQAAARDLQARQAAGQAMGGMFAPPPMSNQPSPQPPMPGQPSVPMGPPSTGQGAPNGGTPPIPPYQTVDRSGGMTGQIPGRPPSSVGFHGDPAVARQAIMSSAMSPQDKQLALRQLDQQAGAMMVPPPVAPQQPQQGQTPTLEGMVKALRDQGVPPDQWLDVLDKMKPVFDVTSKQQLEALKQQKQMADEQNRMLMTELAGRRVAATEDRTSAYMQDVASRGAARAAATTPDVDPESLSSQVDLALSGMPKSQIVAGWGAKASAQWNKVTKGAVEQIMQNNPGMSRADAATEFAHRQLAYKAQGSGQMAEARTGATTATYMRIASGEAKNMISIVQEYSDKVDRTRFPNINAIENAVKKGTGDINIVHLNTALNSLINSYARAISPKGAPTVSDKEHAREVINANYSKGQIQGVLDVMGQEMTAALGSAEEATRGGKPSGKAMSLDDYLKSKGF